MNFGDPDLNEIARLGMLSGEVDQLVCLAVAAVNLIIFLGWSVDQHSHDPAPIRLVIAMGIKRDLFIELLQAAAFDLGRHIVLHPRGRRALAGRVDEREGAVVLALRR